MDASVERRKREAGVRRGRLQVKVMEIIRKVERARRNTEGLMDRNAALGKLLEDIEKGKPENLKDNEGGGCEDHEARAEGDGEREC